MKKEDIFFKVYNLDIGESIEITENNAETIFNFIIDRSAYDHYCNNCNRIKTFIQSQKQSVIVDGTFNDNHAINMYNPNLNDKVITYEKSNYSSLSNNSSTITIYDINSRFFIFKKLKCPTCDEKLTMIFLYEKNCIAKVYQSFISDIIKDEDIQQFKKMKLLNEDDLKELNNANKCKKLGMNIASFVYMRRIFENMLQRIYEAHQSEVTIKDSSKKFIDLFVKDKVKLLKPYLPILMNEEVSSDKYIKLYKLLSEGIHKLNEDICESLYNIIKELLLMILEKEMQEKKNRKNLTELETSFNKIFNENAK